MIVAYKVRPFSIGHAGKVRTFGVTRNNTLLLSRVFLTFSILPLRRTDGQTDGRKDGRTDGRTDGRMDGPTNVKIEGSRKEFQ